MSPEMSGIVIGVGATVGAGLLTLVGSTMVRLWRTPKRIDRLERAIPPVVHGVWALLRIHVREHNGDTDPDVIKAYDTLTRVVTEGIVSQKAQP